MGAVYQGGLQRLWLEVPHFFIFFAIISYMSHIFCTFATKFDDI